MNVVKADRVSAEEVLEVFEKHGGNIRATAKELGIARSTVREKLRPLGKLKKPLAGGTVLGVETQAMPLPRPGYVKRYILTSAQNNTFVHDGVWDSLLALAEHYNAEILVGTYTYNQNHYGKLSVKRGKDKPEETTLWYDPKLQVIGLSRLADERIALGKGLVWCGEYNALPTNVNPLAGLESYTGRQSSIFPHAKLAMRSIPTMQGEGVKLNYTTGTVTQRNYIQKREGVIAEFHHIYGGLLVEVNSEGHWWVRQLNYDEGTRTLQDLNVLVQDGQVVSTSATVESITHGDLHGTMADPVAVNLALDMVRELKPKYQFLHDVMEGVAVNPHMRKHKTAHESFHRWLRGYHRLEAELAVTSKLLERFAQPDVETVIVDSNHDDSWLKRWLREYDYRVDPANAEVFLKLQSWLYNQIRNGSTQGAVAQAVAKVLTEGRQPEPKFVRDVNVIEYALREIGGLEGPARFLKADESFLTCGNKIENGMHGHLGPAGKFGSPAELSKMGRKANTAHTHSTGIWNGLYVAGTLSQLRWDYTKGPTNWSQSEIITYPNGKRTIVTFYANMWRA